MLGAPPPLAGDGVVRGFRLLRLLVVLPLYLAYRVAAPHASGEDAAYERSFVGLSREYRAGSDENRTELMRRLREMRGAPREAKLREYLGYERAMQRLGTATLAKMDALGEAPRAARGFTEANRRIVRHNVRFARTTSELVLRGDLAGLARATAKGVREEAVLVDRAERERCRLTGEAYHAPPAPQAPRRAAGVPPSVAGGTSAAPDPAWAYYVRAGRLIAGVSARTRALETRMSHLGSGADRRRAIAALSRTELDALAAFSASLRRLGPLPPTLRPFRTAALAESEAMTKTVRFRVAALAPGAPKEDGAKLAALVARQTELARRLLRADAAFRDGMRASSAGRRTGVARGHEHQDRGR